MKTLLFLLLIPLYSMAGNIDNYKYYQTDNIISNNSSPYYAAYIKNDNPCIFIKDFKKDKVQEFCQMGESPFNLKRDAPSIYPTRMYLLGSTLFFNVAAPWNEQKCEIYLPDSSITCESTGK
ncbi:hypothetical protein [uncultured Shewanella sp.]|uniref:hypothetical protein n=1 Tax=uncultured Shewanella sp. TaxID=173975 RepID=UPI002633F053|nr:hypothetical protein [uncultured Shewanella sp.]